ncbi:MAG: phosphopyruvate hydratase [Candidatus Pacebacteria bacterium]|nr:phosphopyruvate hydratase [Candidatus Paceibacterota bacterium]
MIIKSIVAQELLDSRGNPTVAVTLSLEDGTEVFSAVPSGASTGAYEALELRDGDNSRYLGKGVLKAVANVNDLIAPKLIGHKVTEQAELDQIMLDLDGTQGKQKLGANAILAVSMACVKAAAIASKMPLYAYIAQLFGNSTEEFTMPIPMANVLNGGKHAIGSSDMQEFMIFPLAAKSVVEAVQINAEIFHHLGKILQAKGMQKTVGDEGGYAPSLGTNEAPLQMMIQAIEMAGYQAGQDVFIALDPAATEFYKNEGGVAYYDLQTENKKLSSSEMVKKYQQWVEEYPIVSIEDGLAEDDWEGFAELTATIGKYVQIMGDDLLVTNPERIQKAIEKKAANSVLIKLNQIGSVSETIQAIKLAQSAGWTCIVSHRSGETEDTFIADFVVGSGTGQIKTGSMCRSERVAKYNRLMMIERELGDKAKMAKFPFHK